MCRIHSSRNPRLGRNIPTVAEFTQGEVVIFAATALQMLAADGWVVLLEGREQQYVTERVTPNVTIAILRSSIPFAMKTFDVPIRFRSFLFSLDGK
jgi:hypothetical protein